MSYSYWNDFVNIWKVNPTPQPILGWTNPNLVPLYNNPVVKDFSYDYIPEPWWGNDGTHALDSVILNYNPGEGGLVQEYANSKSLFGAANYQSFVDGEVIGITNHFPGTNRWHSGKRAKRIFNTLVRNSISLSGSGNIENHLSIELIPWHTGNTIGIQP